MQHRTYAYRIPWTKWSGLVIVASGEVLACFRLRGGLSGKLRLDSSAKHCALLSVFGSRSIVFVLLSPGRIPSELLVVSAAGGLSVRGVQKSSVTCHHSQFPVPRGVATIRLFRKFAGQKNTIIRPTSLQYLLAWTWSTLRT